MKALIAFFYSGDNDHTEHASQRQDRHQSRFCAHGNGKF
jgi:hypothetical protein